MKKLSKHGFAWILLSLIAGCSVNPTIEISEQELQQKIAQIEPVSHQLLFVTITLNKPQINLLEASNRVALSSRIEVNGIAFKTEGLAQITGILDYQPATRSLYFSQPKISQLTLAQIPKPLLKAIKDFGEAALTEHLKSTPIYVIDEKEAQQDWAKSHLKSVSIKNRKLILEMELF